MSLADADSDLQDELETVRDHINAEHGDTVAFVARHLPLHAVPLASSSVTSATIGHLDLGGMGVDIVMVGGVVQSVRHGFAQPGCSLEDVRSEFLAMVQHARKIAGDREPLTTLEAELSGGNGLATYLTEVVETEALQPGLRRIRFGTGLERFESIGGDQFLFLLLPPAGSADLTVDTDFTWEHNNSLPEHERATGAYYSVRSCQPAVAGEGVGSLDMWFVLHGDGRASEWAAAAQVGDRVALWGPRRTFEPPEETDSYLLVADETGFGAVTALLEELNEDPLRPSIIVIAEAERPDLAIEFPMPSNTTVEWVFRNGVEAGSAMFDAVCAQRLGEHVYAYGAGESKKVSAIRRHLRDAVGLSAEQVSMIAYWRRQVLAQN